jgi:hypothetical protein
MGFGFWTDKPPITSQKATSVRTQLRPFYVGQEERLPRRDTSISQLAGYVHGNIVIVDVVVAERLEHELDLRLAAAAHPRRLFTHVRMHTHLAGSTIDVHSLSSTLPNLAPCSISMPLPFPCLLALQPAPRYDTPASSSSSSNSWGLFLTQDAVEGQVLYKGSYQVVDGEDRGGLGRREGGRHIVARCSIIITCVSFFVPAFPSPQANPKRANVVYP